MQSLTGITITMNIITTLSAKVNAYHNCIESGNERWQILHKEKIDELCNTLPHGGGFDCGTKIVLEQCTKNKLVFSTEFHHMDEHGGYSHWTQHFITITPTFGSYDLKVSGKNSNGIKEYIADVFRGIFA